MYLSISKESCLAASAGQVVGLFETKINLEIHRFLLYIIDNQNSVEIWRLLIG